MLQVRRVIASSALVLLLALAGCDGGGGSGVSPSPTPTYPPIPISTDTAPVSVGPTSTPPPSASPPDSPHPSRTGPLTTGAGVKPGERPPEFPTAAKMHTSAGALAMAAYFFRAYDWSLATNDPYLISQVSEATCPACNRVIDALKRLHKHGKTAKGGRIHLVSEKIVTGKFKVKSDYVVQVVVNEDALIIGSPSSPPSTTPAERTTSLVFISWRHGAWRVLDFGAPS